MLDKQKVKAFNSSSNTEKLIKVFRRSRSLDSSVEDQSEFKESDLTHSFNELNIDEKMQVLYEAVLSNAVGIAESDRKLDFFEKTEKISVATWFKKVMIAFLAFFGVIALSTFVFMIIKNGTLNDISVVASFFKTTQEVLNVIFLTK